MINKALQEVLLEAVRNTRKPIRSMSNLMHSLTQEEEINDLLVQAFYDLFSQGYLHIDEDGKGWVVNERNR